jgi:hypothetical protein
MESVALSQKQQSVKLFVFRPVKFELNGFFTIETRKVDIGCVFENFWAS